MYFTMPILAIMSTLSSTSVLAAPVSEPLNNNTTTTNDTTIERRAIGGWVIQNNCNSNIYYTSVDQSKPPIVSTGVVAAHKSAAGPYGGNNNGVAIKMCWAAGCSDPYQFELTRHDASQQIFYDLSAINGDPFKGVHRGVYSSDGSGAALWCNAGSESCSYMFPKDDTHTKAARLSSNIVAQFC